MAWSLWACTAIPAAVLAQPAGPAGIYTCTDAQGRRLTSDRPIALCMDREQRILGASGVERGRIGPSLSESEVAQRQEALKQAEQVRQREREQRRRDAALLVRYPHRQSHDAERRQALSQLESLQILAQKRLFELEKAQFQLEQQLEFYAKDATKVPARLRGELRQAARSIDEQRQYMETQTAELRRVNQRFDAELARLTPLWSSQQPVEAF